MGNHQSQDPTFPFFGGQPARCVADRLAFHEEEGRLPFIHNGRRLYNPANPVCVDTG